MFIEEFHGAFGKTLYLKGEIELKPCKELLHTGLQDILRISCNAGKTLKNAKRTHFSASILGSFCNF